MAREFNNWVKDPTAGWRSECQQANVAVFDLYDVLTDYEASNCSRYPTGLHESLGFRTCP